MRFLTLALALLLLAPAATLAAPAPSITGGPAEGTYTQAERSRFVLGGGGGTITGCTLDDEPLSCAAGEREVDVGPGRHLLTLTSRDADGVSATATRSWTVDYVLPVAQIDGTPASGRATQAREAALTPFAEDTGSPLALACSLDAVAVACASEQTLRFAGLPDGPHELVLVATDAAGNRVERRWGWTVDTVAPVATLQGGPLEGTTSLERSPFITAALDSDGTAECSVDGAPFGPCSRPIAIGPLADGAHAVSARGTDSAGNVGPVATRRFNTGDPALLGRVVPKPVVASPLGAVRVVRIAGRRLSVGVSLTRAATGTVRVERRVRGRWRLQLARRFSARKAGLLTVLVPARRTLRLPRGRYRVVVRAAEGTFPLVSSALTVR